MAGLTTIRIPSRSKLRQGERWVRVMLGIQGYGKASGKTPGKPYKREPEGFDAYRTALNASGLNPVMVFEKWEVEPGTFGVKIDCAHANIRTGRYDWERFLIRSRDFSNSAQLRYIDEVNEDTWQRAKDDLRAWGWNPDEFMVPLPKSQYRGYYTSPMSKPEFAAKHLKELEAIIEETDQYMSDMQKQQMLRRNPEAERGCYPCPDCGGKSYERTSRLGGGMGGPILMNYCSCIICGNNFITRIMPKEPKFEPQMPMELAISNPTREEDPAFFDDGFYESDFALTDEYDSDSGQGENDEIIAYGRPMPRYAAQRI